MWRTCFVSALAVLLLASCSGSGSGVRGSGNIVTVKRAPTGEFEKISINVPARVVVEAGESPASVELTGDDNVLPVIETTVANGTLTVQTAKDHAFTNYRELKIAIAVPSVKALSTSSAATAKLENLKGEVFDLSVTGASEINAKGKVDKLTVRADGGSTLNLGDLESQDVKLHAEGATTAVLNATKSLDVESMGASSISYKGHPARVTKKMSGVGSIQELK